MRIIDSLFSYIFVFLAVITAGLGIRSFEMNKIEGMVELIASVWLFGIGCMGLRRLLDYIRGNCNYATIKERKIS